MEDGQANVPVCPGPAQAGNWALCAPAGLCYSVAGVRLSTLIVLGVWMERGGMSDQLGQWPTILITRRVIEWRTSMQGLSVILVIHVSN